MDHTPSESTEMPFQQKCYTVQQKEESYLLGEWFLNCMTRKCFGILQMFYWMLLLVKLLFKMLPKYSHVLFTNLWPRESFCFTNNLTVHLPAHMRPRLLLHLWAQIWTFYNIPFNAKVWRYFLPDTISLVVIINTIELFYIFLEFCARFCLG